MVDDDPPAGVPDWVLTYGDMMSLLLTFFIMLVSMSELKQDDKFQGVAESLHQQFGYDSTPMSLVPGEIRPRNSSLAELAVAGRTARKQTLESGQNKQRSTAGDNHQVRIVRPGTRTTIGTVIPFPEESSELTASAQEDLRQVGEALRGKPQKIEVRGHTSLRPAATSEQVRDNWDLAYERARVTMQFLIDDLEILPERIRMSVAGPHEPVHIGGGRESVSENPRVEVFLLDEVGGDLIGTPEERSERIAP
jgi:chemotaxis protein MotB